MTLTQDTGQDVGVAPSPGHSRRRRFIGRFFLIAVALLVVAGVAFRIYLPTFARGYVNRTLDRSEIYRGKIGQIDIHLLRGYYSIDDIRLVKVTGDVPVPLFKADRLELALDWRAMIHRRLVGQVVMVAPQLNFVDSPNASDAQTGSGGPWLGIISDLFPFKINSVRVHDGSVHLRTYASQRPVDVYLSQLEASVDDLTNIEDQTNPLITTISAKALAMDQAKFEFQAKLDPFSYRPTFHIGMRLLGLDVTKVNDMALTYGQFDFKRGWFDLILEADAKSGTLNGYVKPLFRNLVLFSPLDDLKNDNPLRFFWQALLGLSQEVLKNQPRDQFGTYIPFSGDVAGTQPDILATIGNVLRNAFVRAYLPKLQPGMMDDDQMLHFQAPEITDPTSVGESER